MHSTAVSRHSLKRLAGLPALVLVLGLLLTLCAWRAAWLQTAHEQQERFENLSSYIVELMEDRLQRSIDLLFGYVGLFQVSDSVSRAEFHAYDRMVQAQLRVPGLIAVQYAPVVRAEDIAALEAITRADDSLNPGGYPHFRVFPREGQAILAPILFNEPMQPNLAAFGHDTLFGTDRRRTADLAVERGAPAFSPPLQLVQGDMGVVIRVPVYRRGQPVATAAQRRASFSGMVNGVFRVRQVLQQALPPQLNGFRLRVIDAAADSAGRPDAELYDSGPLPGMAAGAATLRRRQAVMAGGRVWLMEITAPRGPVAFQDMPLAVLIGGLGLTLPMFAVARSLSRRALQAGAAAEQLHHGAHHDPLTGLANRRGLTERLSVLLPSLEAGGELALLFIDLDRFKAVNDRHGHEMGDDVLKVIAARLRACLRPGDMVARLGGDEFVVLLDRAGTREWHAMCLRVQEAVGEPIVAQGTTVSVGASVGVALAPRDGRDARTLLRHADRRMYELKHAHRRTA